MGNSQSGAQKEEAKAEEPSKLNEKESREEPTFVASQSRDDDVILMPRDHAFVRDEQVQVNLAMADLMAYLQVVANNSMNLPLTKRDDPEMEKVITSLTSEEYARKAAAFIPADVRVIGGSFTRYGKVWDLPTIEEYTAIDGALEPGRSYGGACCNTFLKVLYDAANESQVEAHKDKAAAALFDDEDDEEEEASAWMGKSFKSGFSLDRSTSLPSTPSWVEILRRMKMEMGEIEYPQVPKLTTSRKFDVHKQFSFLPDDFDPKKNRKRALLIGCNYENIAGAELMASHDDVKSIKDYIVNVHGFSDSPQFMTVLMDDGEHEPPTFMNIVDAFKALSEQSQTGDAVFVMFSGHGGRTLSEDSNQEEVKYDESIAPCDYEASGLIRDSLIFKTLLAPMRYGVTVTMMIDCCDNGMMMELPYAWSTRFDRKDSFPRLTLNEDFSFVRFLKVVRTLYESSSFTQLGKTVGSALRPTDTLDFGQDTNQTDLDYDDGYEDHLDKHPHSIFDAIAEACTTSDRFRDRPEYDEPLSPGSTRLLEDKGPASLITQVFNCSLLSPREDEYFSEDDLSALTGPSRSLSYEDRKTRGRANRDRRRRRKALR